MKKILLPLLYVFALILTLAACSLSSGSNSPSYGDVKNSQSGNADGFKSFVSFAAPDADGYTTLIKDDQQIRLEVSELCGSIAGYEVFRPAAAYYGFANLDDGFVVAMSEPALGTVIHWVLVTHDGGETWREIGNADGVYPHQLAGAGMAENGNITLRFLPYGDLKNNMIVSSDEGKTWAEPVFSGLDYMKITYNQLVPHLTVFTGNHCEMLCSLLDENGGVAGTATFKTSDGGLSWAFVSETIYSNSPQQNMPVE